MFRIANIVFNPMTNDSRVIKESISLAKAGYEVEVIAHLDKDLKDIEKKDNFVIRRFSYLDRKITKSSFQKLKVYFKYVKKSVTYCKDFDILHCNDLNALPIAFIVKTFFNKKIKVVYDAHEYETETNSLKGIKQKITKISEKFLMKYVDKTICVSDSIANEYVRLYDIVKPAVVLNTPLFQNIEKKNLFRENLNINIEQNIFLYQGALTYGRGIEILLETFNKLDDNNVIVFMGYGPLEDLLKVEVKKYNNIYFHKAVSPDILLEYTSSADYGISTIEDSCLSYRYCLPNKMFEYMMVEIPLIVSNLPEMKNIVENNKIGVVLNSNSTNDLITAIEKIIVEDRTELVNNLKKAKIIYNWEEQEKKLLKLYADLFDV